MHHSEEAGKKSKIADLMREITKQAGLGATGSHPQGKLDGSDEGEIKIAVAVVDGKVVINFGKPVAWVGFDAKQARQIADLLRQRSYEAE